MMIDLRSDTITKPDEGMLDAIANARFGGRCLRRRCRNKSITGFCR